MVLAGSPTRSADPAVVVEDVALVDLEPWRTASWRAQLADAPDQVITDLVDREALTDEVADVSHLAVRGPDGTPIARGDLRVVGATAQIEDVETTPLARGRGLASAIVLEAARRARDRGCDVLVLEAHVDDWPWQLYERLGFRTVGTGHVIDRDRPTQVAGA
jgi:GNAT superfamily N-acetyltransferase